MNESTSIKYEKVREASEKIASNRTIIQGILDDFTLEMTNATSEGVLQGQAAEGLTLKFEELKKKFDSYIATVKDFEDMINMANEETAATEASIQREAEDLAA